MQCIQHHSLTSVTVNLMLFLILFRGDWVCSLCRDAVQPEVEYDCENERTSGEHTSAHGLAACDLRVGHFISCINDNDGGLSGFGLLFLFLHL